ncbi:MAG: DNA-binding transcriptional LysR family regulator [Saprospiraceae bacterium]|jgi:DNA-binding transcriptional LysR family regulator
MPIHSTYIRYFDEVWRSGSIRKAAAKLHIAPSAVSRQIFKLEEELGVPLFERMPSGIKLTHAGTLFAAHATDTLNKSALFIEELKALKQQSSEQIALAAQESVTSQFLPKVLLEFHSQFPNVSTAFTTASGKELCDLLVDKKTQVAIAFDPEPHDEIIQIACQALPVLAVMTVDHPLAKKKQLNLEECAKHPLILPDASWPLRDILDDLSSQLDQAPHILTSSNSVEFLRKMLATDSIIGFQTLIGIEAEEYKRDLVQIPLLADNQPVTQNFALCIRKDADPSEAFTQLLDLLKNRFKQYQPEAT